MMLPVIDAFTSSTWPLRRATTAMISSAALPNVAFRNPPQAGPVRCASCSVPRAISPASGVREGAAVMKPHGEPCAVQASSHERGTASRRALIGDETTARSMWTLLVPEPLDVFVLRPREQIEEGVQAAIERTPQLRDRAVEGVQCESG